MIFDGFNYLCSKNISRKDGNQINERELIGQVAKRSGPSGWNSTAYSFRMLVTRWFAYFACNSELLFSPMNAENKVVDSVLADFEFAKSPYHSPYAFPLSRPASKND